MRNCCDACFRLSKLSITFYFVFSCPSLCLLLCNLTRCIIWDLSSKYLREDLQHWILLIYLLINIFVFLNCWSLRVVTGWRWRWRKSSQQTAGVLLLAINKLLHKTFPCEQTEDTNGLKTPEMLIFGFLYNVSQHISAKVSCEEKVC